MKFILIYTVALNFFALTVMTQAPPPPPPPLIYKAPEKSDFKEFVSEDKTFEIVFPGVPKITKQEISNGVVTSYRVYRQGSNSIVNTVDYNFDLENQREKVYQTVKNNLTKIPKAVIETERDIKIDGITGKEYGISYDLQFQKLVILIVGRRVYELKSDVTNWHILSRYNKEKVADFENETKRFFASFNSIQTPKIAEIPIPNEFYGETTETSYKNSFFDFSLNIPKGWIRFDPKTIEAGREVGLEMLKTDKEKINQAFQNVANKESVIFVVSQTNDSKGENANFGIGVLKQSTDQITSEKVAIASKDLFLTSPKITLTKDVQKTVLNGIEFTTFSIQTDLTDKLLTKNFLLLCVKNIQ